MKRCMGCMEEYNEKSSTCPKCGYSTNDNTETYHLLPETVLDGRYIIGKAIGAGNYGVTYIAWDSTLQQKVAIKEYLPGDSATRLANKTEIKVYEDENGQEFKAGMEQFVVEAKKLAKLHGVHGIVQVYDSFYANQTAYIVMEYLQGESLGERLKRSGKMPIKDAFEIITQVSKALIEVHGIGMLHRDVAPDNIFLTNEGKIKLLDFGSSRFVSEQKSKSLSVILKAGYSPVEQYISKGKQGPWTDVYAVAATFYRMITGVVPVESIERGVKDTLKSPSSLGVKISKGMENALKNALCIDAENRTQSMEKFLEDMSKEKVVVSKKPKKKEDIGKFTLGWSLRTLLLGCVVIVCFVGAALIDVKPQTEAVSANAEVSFRTPDVRNMSYEEAEKVLQDLGYKVESQQDISKSVEDGYVLKQSIAAGTAVEDGQKIVLTTSRRVGLMPDIKEFILADAKRLLDEMEIEYEVKEEENLQIAPGAVISQSVNPNELVKDKKVVISVATNAEVTDKVIGEVQDYSGRLYDDVKKELHESGLYVAKCDWEYHDDLPMGYIIKQSIEAGTEVSGKDVVAFVVNKGFDKTDVPSVVEKNVDDAVKALRKIGVVVTLNYETSDSVPENIVMSQDVMDKEVSVGTEIKLCVSKGKEKEVIDWTTDASLVKNSKYTHETKTEYRYQTRTKKKETTTSSSSSMDGWTVTGSSQTEGDWGAWSGWSETPASGSSTRQVETREIIKHGSAFDYVVIEYRYRDRSVSMIYYFEREVYSDWSEWTPWQANAVDANDCTNVETRTLYRYTEK